MHSSRAAAAAAAASSSSAKKGWPTRNGLPVAMRLPLTWGDRGAPRGRKRAPDRDSGRTIRAAEVLNRNFCRRLPFANDAISFSVARPLSLAFNFLARFRMKNGRQSLAADSQCEESGSSLSNHLREINARLVPNLAPSVARAPPAQADNWTLLEVDRL